jgi:hypothetical protein
MDTQEQCMVFHMCGTSRPRTLPGRHINCSILLSVAAPILAGIDRFLHLLVNWDQYLAPWIR